MSQLAETRKSVCLSIVSDLTECSVSPLSPREGQTEERARGPVGSQKERKGRPREEEGGDQEDY